VLGSTLPPLLALSQGGSAAVALAAAGVGVGVDITSASRRQEQQDPRAAEAVDAVVSSTYLPILHLLLPLWQAVAESQKEPRIP
jgi:hypothetical protein